MKIFVDLEATGISAHHAEIITGFFLRDDGQTFQMNARPLKWSYEAEKIHGITKQQADQYPSIKSELRRLLTWLPKTFKFICYANPNTPEGFLLYDFAVLSAAILRLDIFEGTQWYYPFMNRFNIERISVHSMVTRAANAGIINIERTKKNKRYTRDLSQTNVAASLGIVYRAHDAQEDTRTTKQIHDIIIERSGVNYEYPIIRTSSYSTNLGLL